MKIPDLVSLEYSVSQKYFHIQPLKDTIKDNMMNAFHRSDSDYLLIAVFETEMDAHLFSERFRAALNDQNRKDIDRLINNALNGE